MKCPVDGATLSMTERNGVEIDYCPTCRGVWLDRGELDKIISATAPAPAPEPQAARQESRPETRPETRPEARHEPRPERAYRRHDDDDDDDDYRRGGYRKKRESFLSDLFDF